MKTLLGLFILTLSFTTSAKSGQLLLRATVPAVLEVKMNGKMEMVIHSNHNSGTLPKIIIQESSGLRKIEITQP